MKALLIGSVLFLSITFTTVAVIRSIEQRRDTDRRIALATHKVTRKLCMKIEKQNAFIFASIERSKNSLPTISYYKKHPVELQNALRLIRLQEHDFKPQPCP